jgi:hypothetical protein
LKRRFFILAMPAFFNVGHANAQSPQYQRGYIRRDGTYVEPHYRTRPDNNPWNNYSTRGNTNPFTGERGYANPYRSFNGPTYPSYETRRR